MAIKQVTCKWCKEKGSKDEMYELKKSHYIHFNCYDAYLEDKEFKAKEAEAQKNLMITIADIYGLDSYTQIPHSFYPYLADIRNGNVLFGKYGKQYKQGASYQWIEYTYDYCREDIKKIHEIKKGDFKNFMAELKYGLAIVRNNLVDAKNKFVAEKNKKEKAEREKQLISDYSEEVTYKKKDDTVDMSDFLD